MTQIAKKLLPITVVIVTLLAILVWFSSLALAQVENPQTRGIGVQGTLSAPPPTTSPSISVPSSGQVISNLPVEVRGVCTNGLLVKLFKNNVFSGSDSCNNGSFSITTDLFSGFNELVARHYDNLDQPGPNSNTVNITFNDSTSRPNIADRITLTTVYASRGADPNKELTWPIVLSGGTAPYAVSVDWGDGSGADVYSLRIPGEFTIKHTYKQAGVYRVLLKATDTNGRVGYLQITAIANGTVSDNQVAGAIEAGAGGIRTVWLWQPMIIMIPLIITTFYLGKKYAVTRIKHKLARGEHPFD